MLRGGAHGGRGRADGLVLHLLGRIRGGAVQRLGRGLLGRN